jgi:hypothetical protein
MEVEWEVEEEEAAADASGMEVRGAVSCGMLWMGGRRGRGGRVVECERRGDLCSCISLDA